MITSTMQEINNIKFHMLSVMASDEGYRSVLSLVFVENHNDGGKIVCVRQIRDGTIVKC